MTHEKRDSSGAPNATPVTQNPQIGQGQNELNQEVAKLLGYTNLRFYSWENGDRIHGLRGCSPGQVHYHRGTIPDYCNDLSACAEFEKRLTENQLDDYLYRLEQGPRPAALATAEQRCRAFVATMEGRSVGDGNEKSIADQGSPKSESLGANK